MPNGAEGGFAFLMDVPRAVVVLDCSEPCTGDRLTATIRGVLADPRYEATFTWIADMRHERDAPDPDTVRALVAVIDAQLAPCSARRWVRVVDRRHPSIYGCARMADAFMETVGWESFSCGTLEEAFAWCRERTSGATCRPPDPPRIAPAHEPTFLTLREWPARPAPLRPTAEYGVARRPPGGIPDRRRVQWT
jgi:hypothetical protein